VLDECRVIIVTRHQGGKWTLEDAKNDAAIANEALENVGPKDMVKLGVCPTCRRVVGKITAYRPMASHLRLIERMWRTIKSDPLQRDYCFITNNTGMLNGDERILAIGGAARDQYHKAVWLDLIAPVGKDGSVLSRDRANKPEHRDCCYTVTKKGMDLILGDYVSPFVVYRQHGRYVLNDKSAQSRGCRKDVDKSFQIEQLPPDLADLLVKRPAIIYERAEPKSLK